MRLLTTPEVAKRLGITVSRVQALINDRRLPAQKIGRDFMVREEDLVLVGSRQPGRSPAQLQLDYWAAFRDFVLSQSRILKPPLAKAQRNMIIKTTRGCRLAASLHINDRQIWVDLTFGRDSKKYFQRLEKNHDSIEEQIGFELEWVARPEGIESWILVREPGDPTVRGDWTRQHSWLCEKLEKFSTVLLPKLANLR